MMIQSSFIRKCGITTDFLEIFMMQTHNHELADEALDLIFKVIDQLGADNYIKLMDLSLNHVERDQMWDPIPEPKRYYNEIYEYVINNRDMSERASRLYSRNIDYVIDLLKNRSMLYFDIEFEKQDLDQIVDNYVKAMAYTCKMEYDYEYNRNDMQLSPELDKKINRFVDILMKHPKYIHSVKSVVLNNKIKEIYDHKLAINCLDLLFDVIDKIGINNYIKMMRLQFNYESNKQRENPIKNPVQYYNEIFEYITCRKKMSKVAKRVYKRHIKYMTKMINGKIKYNSHRINVQLKLDLNLDQKTRKTMARKLAMSMAYSYRIEYDFYQNRKNIWI